MTRFITLITLSTLSLVSYAQYPGGMSDADMQQMMQGAQAMAACMENIDQDALNRLSAESQQVEADVKALCTEGKRDEAQSKAIAFGMKAANDPAMQAMAECGEQAQGMMPAMKYADAEHEYANRHVCDE